MTDGLVAGSAGRRDMPLRGTSVTLQRYAPFEHARELCMMIMNFQRSGQIRRAVVRAFIGTAIGFLIGLFFLAIGLIRWLIARSPGEGLLGDLFGVVAYVLGAAAAGGVGGILFPLTRHWLGAGLCGAITFQPFLLAIMFLIEGANPFVAGADRFAYIIMSVVSGPLMGIVIFRGVRKEFGTLGFGPFPHESFSTGTPESPQDDAER
jgi:hypothetical protein